MGTACSYFSLIRVLTRFLLLACEVVRLVGFSRLKPIKKAERCFATPFRTSKNIQVTKNKNAVAKVSIICDICECLQYN